MVGGPGLKLILGESRARCLGSHLGEGIFIDFLGQFPDTGKKQGDQSYTREKTFYVGTHFLQLRLMLTG